MKQMLITVGTTKFESLIKAIDNEEFYKLLDDQGFNRLIIQKGFGECIPSKFSKLNLKFLEVKVETLIPNFEDVIDNSDYIISHAGGGNVLESLKHKKKIFVAVNDTLMDNHQVELAETLSKENYLYYVKDLTKIVEDVRKVLENKSNTQLKDYPDFNLDIIPDVIYDMLDI